LFLNFDLFVESARKIDIWHFIKKSISDSRNVENNSDKRFQKRVLFNQHRLKLIFTTIVPNAACWSRLWCYTSTTELAMS